MMIDRVEKTFLPTIEILAKNREKHLNPSQTTKSHFCPIIDIMLNRYIGNPPPKNNKSF